MEWRAYRKVLRMVSELHVRGYQRIRIEPGMAASGAAWRCAMAPATSFSVSDWPYAGWYLEMLHITYPDSFPVAYADWWDFPTDYLPTTGARKDLRIPLPPAGWGPATRDG